MDRDFSRRLAAFLLGALMLCWVGVVQAQTISNIAHASWSVADQANTTQSNPVSFTVAQAPAAIEILHIAPRGTRELVLDPARCSAGLGVPPGPVSGGVSAGVEPAVSFRVGEQVIVSLRAPSSDLDPAGIDYVAIEVTSSSGDRETLQLPETDIHSGVFVGTVQTVGMPPPSTMGDCRLSVMAGDKITVEATIADSSVPIVAGPLNILADPFGIVFDSLDGALISGAKVTLIDAATGAPARVWADDGVTDWPSAVISGQPVIDGAGLSHPTGPGEYRFPLTALGTYRLLVEPPAPYSSPSTATPAQLAGLTRPDGEAFRIAPASFGGTLSLVDASPVAIDIPLDAPPGALSITKTVSRPIAAPGDVAFYTVVVSNPEARSQRAVTVVDTASTALRLRPDSVRIDGVAAPNAVSFSADGHVMTIALGDLSASATKRITYAASVRNDAGPGQAVNRAVASNTETTATASAVLRIERPAIASRMTLIGRITRGDCSADWGEGLSGVRVMLEDGSFAVTDAEGRYHFEGLRPGTHVVQAEPGTLPGKAGAFVDCSHSTRTAGSANSRFVMGQGGTLAVADFVARVDPLSKPAAEPSASPLSDAAAAGGATDFVALGDGPIDWLFPAPDHNPRAPAVRVAIRHKPSQTVALFANDRKVDPLSFDGATVAPGGAFAVSVWRGVPLEGKSTRLRAVVHDADGSVATELTREVHFNATPARAELVADRSRLIADGATRPVLAVRLVDRDGRPVHAGLSGDLSINRPYESAEALDRLQSGQLVAVGSVAPRWFVAGDDGIALIELAPTLVSGALSAQFSFTDGDVHRTQSLDAWIVPGDQEWTLVGLAEGALGANLEPTLDPADTDFERHARVAFYAKGRVLGSALLTVAYDSRKKPADERLLGVIDPRAYYTVFADGSERRFDAASRDKLYVRIESSTFYALYGDFDTGFDQTQLARYQRTATGFKGGARVGAIQTSGFAASISSRHRHDEIQGDGLSGPYRLSSRSFIANSETVTLETRDRFRSELVLQRKTLTRFLDYDIDSLSGSITFAQPVLSRDADLNPNIIVIDYESDGLGNGALNAGARATWTGANGAVRIGATALSDRADAARTGIAAVDVKAQLAAGTEVRAEWAASRTQGESDWAWLVEAEHHDGRLDLLAYAHQLDPTFGLDQQSAAERGRRKFGLDARAALSDELSLTASTWFDDSLSDTTHRTAARLRADLRRGTTDARLAVSWFQDRLVSGENAGSAILEGGLTQRLLDNRLELDGSTSIALTKTESVDLPARHRLAARYALTPAAKLIGSYEIAAGDAIDARTARVGIELAPWSGARMVTTVGQNSIAEQGKRSFAAIGLAQSWQASPRLVVDATLDANRVLGGFPGERVINPEHPAASGGFLSQNGALSEEFTAITIGAGYRVGRWSATARAEYRNGEREDRTGFLFGAIRQLGEGSVIGSGVTWTRTDGPGGTGSAVVDAAVSAAWRPADRPFSALGKLEYRSDTVSVGAGVGLQADGALLTVDKDTQARRLLASLSANWSPRGRDAGRLVQRSELALFVGARYALDSYEGTALSGVSLLGGMDGRIGLGDRFEIGASATVRADRSDRTLSYAVGPTLGFVPTKDMLLTIGYNVVGFHDPDFYASRSTGSGVVGALKMKFNSSSLAFLGLSR